MERWTTSPLYPLTAAAIGVLSGLGLIAAQVTPLSAFAVSLGLFAAVMTMRNWWVSEEERPLLAEELIGLHDAAASMRADLKDLRMLVGDLAELAERVAAAMPPQGERAASALEAESLRRGVNSLQERLTEMAQTAPIARDSGDGGAEPDRVAEIEARERKLAEALSIAVQEMRRHADRLQRLERAAPSDPLAVSQPPAPERAAPKADMFATTPRNIQRNTQRDASGEFKRRVSDRVESDRSQRLNRDIEAAARSIFERAGADRADQRVSAGAPAAPVRELKPAVSAGSSVNSDVVTQAVVDLDTGQPRFFEVMSATRMAELDVDAAASGLDRGLLARSFDLLDQLTDLGGDEGVFCNLSLGSLNDAGFVGNLISRLEQRGDLAGLLVFEFDQADVDRIGEGAEAALIQIRELGFAFSLDGVVDWSADITRLAKLGFQFVKLDCEALVQRAIDSPGAAERLIGSFDRVGLTLIVENVDHLGQVEDLAQAGARLAQGPSLAPARRLIDETSHAAAAGAGW